MKQNYDLGKICFFTCGAINLQFGPESAHTAACEEGPQALMTWGRQVLLCLIWLQVHI